MKRAAAGVACIGSMTATRNGGLLALLFIMSSAVRQDQEEEGTALKKVLVLMDTMVGNVVASEGVQVTAKNKLFAQCKAIKVELIGTDGTDGKIGASKLTIKSLQTDIEQAIADADAGDATRIAAEGEAARHKTDRQAANNVRELEKTDYIATIKAYGNSLHAIENSVASLKANKAKASSAASSSALQESLLQLQVHRSKSLSGEIPEVPASLITALSDLEKEYPDNDDDDSDVPKVAPHAKKALVVQKQVVTSAVVSQEEEDSVESGSAPAPAAAFAPAEVHGGLDFQSGGVVAMLDALHQQFLGEEHAFMDSEAAAVSAHEALTKQLDVNRALAKAASAAGTKQTIDAKAKNADCSGKLSDEQVSLAADQADLASTIAACQKSATDFEVEMRLLSDEKKSLTKAVKILTTMTSSSLRGFLQVSSSTQRHGTVLSQLRSVVQDPVRGQIASFLVERAHSLSSPLLLDLAQRVQNDPLKKIKKLIQKLIIKLVEEANSEMDKKGLCDTELAVNKVTRDKKTKDVEELLSTIETLDVDIKTLIAKNAQLTGDIGDLDKQLAETQKTRFSDKATNDKDLKMHKADKAALEAAIAALKDFYSRSAGAAAFVQAEAAISAPQLLGSFVQDGDQDKLDALDSETDTESEGSGAAIVALLETILSDTVKNVAQTESLEDSQVEAFKKYSHEVKKSKTVKNNEIRMQTNTLTGKKSDAQEARADLLSTQESLTKALKYYEKLRPSCIDTGSSYAVRVGRRKDEIKSLQEAMETLLKQKR